MKRTEDRKEVDHIEVRVGCYSRCLRTLMFDDEPVWPISPPSARRDGNEDADARGVTLTG